MLTLILALSATFHAGQEPSANDAAEAQVGAEAPATPTAEGLRSKVHKMRMDLILGGDQVQHAESEAIDFYNERLEIIDRRLDRIDVDLSEKRASYRLALDRTVNSPNAAGSTIREASRFRGEISDLEAEAVRLRGKRAQLAALVDSIADRGVDREALAANLEANNVVGFDGGLPLSTIGFGPQNVPPPEASPFDDPQMVRELVALDPRRGRAALFAEDPEGYWDFFTLRLPVPVLRNVLEFPPADLPGER